MERQVHLPQLVQKAHALPGLLETINEEGLRGKVFFVGGIVRDLLRGEEAPSSDLDMVVEGDSASLATALHVRGYSSPPVTYPRFGTAMVKLGDLPVELVTARAESYSESSRKPEVGVGSLMDDALRRDFTVNALMADPFTGEVVDLLGTGLSDLEAKVLRTPLEPGRTFFDDPLRLLRAVRFAAKLDFEFAPGLEDALIQHAERLSIISAERIAEEMSKTMVLPRADEALAKLQSTGLLKQFWPEFEPTVGCEQGEAHFLDVWQHTLLVVKQTPPELVTRLAALFHDVGKPSTKTVEADGRIRFLTHDVVGAEMAYEMLKRLRFPMETAERVSRLVREHMRLISAYTITKPAARRVLRDLGDDLDEFFDLVSADMRSLHPDQKTIDVEATREFVMQVSRETPEQVLRSPLSGAEIMAITGLEPGPEVGTIKNRLTEMIIEGGLRPDDREAAEQTVAENWRVWVDEA